jgi:hypothetical protein
MPTNIASFRRVYAPGSVVSRYRNAVNRFESAVNLPTLVNFAEPAFQANHCFAFGGVETIDGRPLARIDYLAADRITTPDVDGAIYLDTATFQIRLVTLTLTQIPAAFANIDRVTVATRFREIAPSISVIDRVTAANVLAPSRGANPTVENTEEQRLLEFRFVNNAPSGTTLPRRPPKSSSARLGPPLDRRAGSAGARSRALRPR